MERSFARRMQFVTASEIREILKVTEHADIISLAGGLPAPELFPARELAALGAEILEGDGCRALQYSSTEGCPALREQIAARVQAKQGVNIDADGLLITAGSQQGLDLTGKLFLDEGDAVACESPTYVGAIQAFTIHQPRWVEIDTDNDGIVPEDLDRKLAQGGVKFLYVIPDFQNPTGRCWSLERRHAVLDIAARRAVPVIEDNPYGELRFEGQPLPSLLSLDRRGNVISLGTFSKVFCPGLRLGWLIAPAPVLRRYVLLKQGTDLHTATLTQRMCALYMKRYGLDDTIARIRAVYCARRNAMLAAIEREFPRGMKTTRPQGGLFLWVELPEGIDAKVLLHEAVNRQVAYVPGSAFFPNGGHANTMRLNYSNVPEERIDEGVTRLGALLRETLAAGTGGSGGRTVAGS